LVVCIMSELWMMIIDLHMIANLNLQIPHKDNVKLRKIIACIVYALSILRLLALLRALEVRKAAVR
jgi:hypothetical protein